jgi:hypothetical protein
VASIAEGETTEIEFKNHQYRKSASRPNAINMKAPYNNTDEALENMTTKETRSISFQAKTLGNT